MWLGSRIALLFKYLRKRSHRLIVSEFYLYLIRDKNCVTHGGAVRV
jgi:hypothetical protein